MNKIKIKNAKINIEDKNIILTYPLEEDEL